MFFFGGGGGTLEFSSVAVGSEDAERESGLGVLQNTARLRLRLLTMLLPRLLLLLLSGDPCWCCVVLPWLALPMLVLMLVMMLVLTPLLLLPLVSRFLLCCRMILLLPFGGAPLLTVLPLVLVLVLVLGLLGLLSGAWSKQVSRAGSRSFSEWPPSGGLERAGLQPGERYGTP